MSADANDVAMDNGENKDVSLGIWVYIVRLFDLWIKCFGLGLLATQNH